MEGIIAAVITGVLALAGVIITNSASNKKIEHSLDKAQAVTDTKLDELTREVRAHNESVVKIPILELKVDNLEKRMDTYEQATK